MPPINIYTIGKAKESWLQEALAEYEKRLPFTIRWHLCKDDAALAAKIPNTYIALDPTGTTHTSESFAHWFIQSYPRHFIIGGAEGLTPKMRQNAQDLISLSPLTFTHQLTRLILLEQLYRATQIDKNTDYHK